MTLDVAPGMPEGWWPDLIEVEHGVVWGLHALPDGQVHILRDRSEDSLASRVDRLRCFLWWALILA